MTAVQSIDCGAGRGRRLTVLAVLAVLLAGCVLASVTLGARTIPPAQVWQAVVAPAGGETDLIVHTLRIPRTLLGLVVGCALGMAGALMQGHTRNPLAEPGLLGVSAGAGLLVVIAIFALGVTSPIGYVWFAFAGTLGASVLVFAVGSTGRSGPTPVTLALAGAAVSALLGAVTAALVLRSARTLDAYRFWAVGSVAGREPDLIVQIAPFLVVGTLLALANAPGLNLLALGEDTARGLGQNVTRTRCIGLAAITLLTGSGVAACGPIWFLGLVVPHIARRLTGPDHRWLLPAAGLTGGVVLLVADIAGRLLAGPGELPVGIMLAVVGVPFFVALVRGRRLAQL